MTEQVREKIVATIRAWIETNEHTPLRDLKATLRAAGIPAEAFEKEQPKAWITRQFPEFRIVGTNGHERVQEVDTIMCVLRDAVEKEGRILLSAISPLLSEHDIDWKQFAPGKKMSEWLEEDYAGLFSVSPDRLWLYAGSGEYMPAASTRDASADQSTKSHVFQFCFLPSSSVILKQLRDLMSDENISQTQWNNQRAIALSRCLLGFNGGLLDDSEAQVPRMAYYTGLKTPYDQEIYGIMERNPNQGAVQKWIFSGVAFPGQETEEGRWLCSAFGLRSQLSYGSDQAMAIEEITSILGTLELDCAELTEKWASVNELLCSGKKIPDAVAEPMLRYVQNWGLLKKALATAGVDIAGEAEESFSLKIARELLEDLQDSNRVLEKIKKCFEQLIEETWLFLEECGLLSDENAMQADKDEMQRCLQSSASAESAEQLRTLVQPYAALRTLQTEKKLSDEAVVAIEAVENHFGTACLNVSRLKRSIWDAESDMGFLSLVDELNSYLLQMEIDNHCGTDAEIVLDDAALLDAALEGNFWRYAQRAFGTPNPLEEAVMLGDVVAARAFLKDEAAMETLNYAPELKEELRAGAEVLQLTTTLTPVQAADRLELLLGDSCRMIDRCLLFGIAQKETGASERLIQHYIRTQRYSLAARLFEKSVDMMSGETRRVLMRSLASVGCLSAEEIIRVDISTLLTDEGMEIVRNMQIETGMLERLSELHEKIQPTLLRHIVFLGSELQSYVLRAENAEELEKYGMDLSDSGIAALLRKNTFARGTTPLQVAKRLYAFVGNWDDLARQFALLETSTPERQGFLMELYFAQGDRQGALRLLRDDTELRDLHFSTYVKLLFDMGAYEELCDAMQLRSAWTTEETMVYLISMGKSGRNPELPASFDAVEAVELPVLLKELSKSLAALDIRQHQALLLCAFPIALARWDEEKLTAFVTGDGVLDTQALHALAQAGEVSCPALTVYCARLLNTSDFDAVKSQYLKLKYDEMNGLDMEGKYALARELRTLEPVEFSDLVEQLLAGQISEVLAQGFSPEQQAQRISALLVENNCFVSDIQEILRALASQDIIYYAPLYTQLQTMIKDDADASVYLDVLHQYRHAGDKTFRRFVCMQYLDAHKRGLLEESVWDACEAMLIEEAASLPRAEVQNCLTQMALHGNRTYCVDFARLQTTDVTQEDGAPTETKNCAEEELKLLCDILKEEDSDVLGYLRFCSVFRMPETPMDEEKVVEDMASVLQALYLHPTTASYWEAFEKLIPQERPRARSRAMFFIASYQTNEEWTVGKANAAWERCVLYCKAENLDDLFYETLCAWLRDINTHYVQQLSWYVVRPYMQTLQKMLEESDPILQSDHAQLADFPNCDEETAEQLMRELISVFKRIEETKNNRVSGDDNHVTLRVIVELGLRLNCEQLLLESLSEEFFGAYDNLGVMLICRLLLDNRFSVVLPFLKNFVIWSRKEYNYAALIRNLAAMECEADLQAWMSDKVHRETLKFILPNGNAPDLLRLQTLVMTGSVGDDEVKSVCIAVIETLIECYPKDVMCYKALYVLCKENYMGNLPRIQRALIGIYKFYGNKKRRSLYTRDRSEIGKLMVILHKTMEVLGVNNDAELKPEMEALDCSDKEELITKLVRSYVADEQENVNKTVSDLNELAVELQSSFVGLSENDLLVKSLLGAVTGNWMPFIQAAFEAKATGWIQNYRVDQYSIYGQLRGVLRVWRWAVAQERQDEFLEWIYEELESNGKSKFAQVSMGQLKNIVTRVDADSISWSMLRLPWEEHLVCFGDMDDIQRPEKNCCYKLMLAERRKDTSARDSFILMIRLAQDVYKAKVLYDGAAIWFTKGNYALAGAAYEALLRTRILPEKMVKNPQVYYERYETWMRLAYVFAGEGLGEKQPTPRSCINMIVELINSGHAAQLDRLRSAFKGVNLKLLYEVHHVLADGPSEEEMLGTAKEIGLKAKPNAELAFLYFLLCQNMKGEYWFWEGPENSNSEKAKQRFEVLWSMQAEDKKTKHWFSLNKRPKAETLPPLAELAEDFDIEETTTTEHLRTKLQDSTFEPAFISEIEILESDATMEELQQVYKSLSIYSDPNYSERLKVAAQMYSVGSAGTAEEKARAVGQLGISYYYYNRICAGKSERPEVERKAMHQTMLDLAIYGLRAPAGSDELVQFLPLWLQHSVRGFANVGELLNDYSVNRSGYAAVAQLLSDTEHADAMNGILMVLNSLLAASNRLGTQELDMEAYQTAFARLSTIRTSKNQNWEETLSALAEMLRQAINKLDQHPSLHVTLFNDGQGLQYDGLYGEIENTGREPAYHLEMQATFPGNACQKVSSAYRISVLGPNEKAAFSISYAASDDLTELEYVLNLSYNDCDEPRSAEPVVGVLQISPNPTQSLAVPQFDTQLSIGFDVDEDGNIVSPDFVGRDSEIGQLTELVAGEQFSKYQSAIVQGIKRSGKTSLLNYLRTYIKNKRSENALELFVDCQNITKPYLYKTFIKPVLDELPIHYSEILEHPGWMAFQAQWTADPSGKDIDLADLKGFYLTLHTMLDGKGLYMIIDEFDVLLRNLGETGHDTLLQTLRALRMDTDCRNAVQFLLCGSNQLLVYEQTGSAINQMFQCYKKIPVGQMLISDIQKMIYGLLEQNPEIRFAKGKGNAPSPTIQWIERYTGGLVWYTRLLVNEAIKAVVGDKRNCVYPSDICNAFAKICEPQNCRQLMEACGSSEELVLDAMQFLSYKYRNYVSVEQLQQLLDERMSAEQIKQSLSILTEKLELLERKSPDSPYYRFRIELYRRYFRMKEDNKFNDYAQTEKYASVDCFVVASVSEDIQIVGSDSVFDDM